jgi:hypothetical protein
LGRVEGAAAEDQLAVGLDALPLTATQHFHAAGPLLVEEHAQHLGVGHYPELWAVHDRVQVTGGGRTTFAVFRAVEELRDLIEADAFLLGAIEVGIGGDAGLDVGSDEGLTDRARMLPEYLLALHR